ncbi:MAG: shikimate dehydrogenase [Rothia sp. (in: high G+C Gram-positive bacteria)]|nr:shikimate dehydrogenase [Rothia sp. (in: high G+C Gram-positive bacteria)]
MSVEVQGRPKAFVLGHPIGHSKSPLLHRAAYSALDIEMTYEALDTTESQLAQVFVEHTPERGTRGFSVTMPLKSAVVRHVDELTPFAQVLGVVNTVYWRQDTEGKFSWYGDNTDVSGIVNALRQAGFEGVPLSPAVIGGGGTASAALAALRTMGARSVRVFVRNASRVRGLVKVASRLGMKVEILPLADFAHTYGNYDITVCTLPAGAADQLLSHAETKEAGFLLDVSYDPWPSALARNWEQAGGNVTSGLEMLMYQAVDQVKLFTAHPRSSALPRQEQVLAAMRQAVALPDSSFVPITVNNLDYLAD